MQYSINEQQALIKRLRDHYQLNKDKKEPEPFKFTPADDLILNDIYSSLAALRFGFHNPNQ